MILHQVDDYGDGDGYGVGNGDGNGYGHGDGYSHGGGDGYGNGTDNSSGSGNGHSCADDVIPPCVSQMYLLAAMVNRGTLIPNVQELTKEKDDEENTTTPGSRTACSEAPQRRAACAGEAHQGGRP
jgi:hypothetical protein